MKQTKNNEMDLMLRGLARREGAGSDQGSRGMIRGRTDEAIAYQIVARSEDMAGRQGHRNAICERRFSLRNRQRAHRDKRTILATIALLLFRTAVHAVGHGCGTARHVARPSRHVHGRRQPLCRSGRRQGRSNEPSDRNDRKQTTDESAQVHGSPSHTLGNLGSWITSQIRQQSQQNHSEAVN